MEAKKGSWGKDKRPGAVRETRDPSIIKKIQVQTTTSDRFGRNFVKLTDLRSVRIGQMSTAALHAMAKHWKQPRWSADKKTHE